MSGSPESDPQRKKVYDWENSFTLWVKPRWKPAEMRALVRKACRLYRVPVPKMRFSRSHKEPMSYWNAEENVIVFIPSQMTADVALHEVAHFISDWVIGEDGLEIHGPEFVGIYAWLLEHYHLMPDVALTASLESAGIAYIDPWRVSPKHIRKSFGARVLKARRLRRELAQFS